MVISGRDIGRIHGADGIVITDRKKDIIIRGGENIAAREVEETLLASESVAEVAVVAVPHRRLGEGVAACIVPSAGCEVTMEMMNETLEVRGLAKQKWPQHISRYDTLPKTARAKCRKNIAPATSRPGSTTVMWASEQKPIEDGTPAEVTVDSHEAFRDSVRTFLGQALTPELKRAGELTTSVFSDFEAALKWHKLLHAQGGWRRTGPRSMAARVGIFTSAIFFRRSASSPTRPVW